MTALFRKLQGETQMAGISLTAVEGLPDVLGAWRYMLNITPTGAANAVVVQALQLRCQQIDFSGVTVETVPVSLHGHEVQFRGRQTFSKSISSTFIETVDGVALNALLGWKEMVVGTRSGNGAYKAEYAAMGDLQILDVTGKVVHDQSIFYMFPTEISNISLDGGSSGPVAIQCTWSYDFVIKDSITIDGYGTPATL